MPTSNAVQPGQSLYATRSGALARAGDGGAATLAALAEAAGPLVDPADALASVPLLHPNRAAASVIDKSSLVMRRSVSARVFRVGFTPFAPETIQREVAWRYARQPP